MKQYLFNILVGVVAWIIYASLNNSIIVAIVAFLLSFVIGLWRALMTAVTWTAYFLSLPLTISITLQLSNVYVALVTFMWGSLLYWLFYHFVLRRYAWTTVPKKDGLGSTLATPRRLTRTSTLVVEEAKIKSSSKEEVWAKAVEECNLFGFLEDAAMKLLLKDVREVDMKPGEAIENSGDFMLLLQGEVELSLIKPPSSAAGKTKKCQLAVMKANDPLGSLFDVLASLCQASLRPLTTIEAVTLSDVKVLVIPRDSFVKLREQFPKAAAHIVQVVLRRFQKVAHSLLNRYFDVSMHESCIFPAKSSPSEVKSPLAKKSLAEEMSNWSRADREAWQKIAFSHLMKSAKLGKGNDGGMEKYRPFWDTITLALAETGSKLSEKDGKCNSLIVLLDGAICLDEKAQGEDSVKSTITQSGTLVNAASSFLGNRALSTIVAEKESLVAHIDRRILEVLIDREPMLLLNLAKPIIERIPPIFNCVERSLEWTNLRPGQSLCQRGQAATHLYVILNGRIRGFCGLPEDLSICIHQQDCPDCSLELGQGESIGETEVLLGQAWASSFLAVRDTEVVAMPKSLFDCLLSSAIDPSIALNLSRMIASKVNTVRSHNASNSSDFPTIRASNVKTVAIVPISPSFHHLAAAFAHSLRDELCLMSNGLLLDSTIPLEVLGKEAFSAIGQLRLTDWLNQCEQDYRLVLYLADAHPRTSWTNRCIGQADIIFFVAWADSSEPHILGTHEKLLVADQQSFVKCELVLIHPKRFCRSGSTRPWLEARPWISMHHHVHLGEKIPNEEEAIEGLDNADGVENSTSIQLSIKRRQLVNMLMTRIDNLGLMYPRDGLFSIFPVHDTFRPPGQSTYQSGSKGQFNDCARIARRLLGRGVGLVLGGGGGRGISHMGILRQLVDAGVPIDAIGGTSIGAFIGGLFARDQDCDTVQGFLKAYARTLANPVKSAFMDLTLPIAAYFTGHSMNRGVWKAFGGREIEDLWLPYFAVSVDVARTGLKVHRSGVIWRYVRASMSIAGLLPPLCDGDSLLVDGGYLNNVPADIMARSGDCGHIIAIDVGSTYPSEVYDYGDTLSGWWALLQRLFGKAPHILSYAEIQSRLAYAMCDSSLLQLINASKVNSRIQYLKPPVGNAAVLSFDRFDEMLQIGVAYGQERISRWREDGTLDQLMGIGPREDQEDSHPLGLVPLSALAEDKDTNEGLTPALEPSLSQLQSNSSHEISLLDEMDPMPKISDSVYSKVSSVETTPLLQANSSFNRRRRTRSL